PPRASSPRRGPAGRGGGLRRRQRVDPPGSTPEADQRARSRPSPPDRRGARPSAREIARGGLVQGYAGLFSLDGNPAAPRAFLRRVGRRQSSASGGRQRGLRPDLLAGRRPDGPPLQVGQGGISVGHGRRRDPEREDENALGSGRPADVPEPVSEAGAPSRDLSARAPAGGVDPGRS